MINLDAYLAALPQSFRFNVRKTDRFFQDTDGTTIADDVGETIALALDSASWGGLTLAQLPELVADWSFDTPAAWSIGTDWAISGGKATFTVAGLNRAIAPVAQPSLAANGRYHVAFLLSGISGQAALAVFNAASSVNLFGGYRTFAADGAYTRHIVPASASAGFNFYGGNTTTSPTWSAESLSLKYLTGYHGQQTGASSLRPIRQAEGAKFDASDDNWPMTYLAYMSLGSELFPDGGMSDASTGWTYTNASGSIVSGALRVLSTVSGAATRAAYKTLSGLTIGVKYRVTCDVIGAGGTSGASATARIQALTTGDVAIADSEVVAGVGSRSLVFTATATSHRIQCRWNLTGGDTTTYVDFDNVSVKAISGQNNFIQVRTTVPASVASTQAIAGTSGPSAHRLFVGINTSGFACGGVGDNSSTTIVGTTDLRNTEADIALTFDGTTVRLIVNGAVEYEGAQAGAPTTSIPFRVGALNNNGTGGSYYGGAVKDIAGGADFLDVAKFNQIRAAMAAN